MKKILTILIVLILSSTHSQAQTNMYIAPKFGINGLASFTEQKDFSFDIKNGYQFGAEFGIKWFELIGLKTELLYANHDFEHTRSLIYEDDQGNTGLFNERVDVANGNIEFNLTLAIQLGDGFEVSIGPQLGLLLSSEGEGVWDFGSGSGTDSMVSVQYDYIDDPAGTGAYFNQQDKDGNYFNNATYDLNIGLSLRLIKGLYVDIRTNYDLSDVINDHYLNGLTQKRTFDVILTTSYRIPLNKKKTPDTNFLSN